MQCTFTGWKMRGSDLPENGTRRYGTGGERVRVRGIRIDIVSTFWE